MKKERIFYFDLLRVVACAAVIIIHLASKYIIEESLPTFNFWTSDVINSLVRYAVPIFVMLSGALFLDESYEFTKKKHIGHIKRMVIFFVCWSVLYETSIKTFLSTPI